MRRSRLALLALGALGVAAGAYAVATRPTDAPKTGVFVEPDPIDFGDVPWRDAPTRTIRLTNRTSRDVLLRDPRLTCSCFTIVKQVPPAVHPGTTIEFVVQLWSSKGTPGRFRKQLLLETDDPSVGTLDIPVVGAITDFRSVTPTQLVLGAIAPDDDPVRKVVEVRSGSGYAVRVATAKSSDARLALEVKPVEGGADVIVTTVERPAKGWISTQLRIELDVGAIEPGARGVSAQAGTRRYTETVRVSGEVK